jgi:hypothetical protein
MSATTLSADSLASHLMRLDRLAAIKDQSEDLVALLASGAELPPSVAGEAPAVLARLDEDLAELLERVGQAWPG